MEHDDKVERRNDMDDYQVEGLVLEIRRISDELKNIRVLMAADLLLKTYQHTEEDEGEILTVTHPITDLIDTVQELKYD
jgi:hypothetical protein